MKNFTYRLLKIFCVSCIFVEMVFYLPSRSAYSSSCFNKIVTAQKIVSTAFSHDNDYLAVIYVSPNKAAAASVINLTNNNTRNFTETFGNINFKIPISDTLDINWSASESDLSNVMLLLANGVVYPFEWQSNKFDTKNVEYCQRCQKFLGDFGYAIAMRKDGQSNLLKLDIHGLSFDLEGFKIREFSFEGIKSSDLSFSPNGNYFTFAAKPKSYSTVNTVVHSWIDKTTFTTTVNSLRPSWVSNHELLIIDNPAKNLLAQDVRTGKTTKFLRLDKLFKHLEQGDYLTGVSMSFDHKYLLFEIMSHKESKLLLTTMTCLN